MWQGAVLPPAPARITFWLVLRGSLLPLLIWTGIACFVYAVYSPVLAAVLGGCFALSCAVGFGLRRRAGHTVRCSFHGALSGVLDKSMAGW